MVTVPPKKGNLVISIFNSWRIKPTRKILINVIIRKLNLVQDYPESSCVKYIQYFSLIVKDIKQNHCSPYNRECEQKLITAFIFYINFKNNIKFVHIEIATYNR
jgi:hypothetical protein